MAQQKLMDLPRNVQVLPNRGEYTHKLFFFSSASKELPVGHNRFPLFHKTKIIVSNITVFLYKNIVFVHEHT